MCMNNTTSELIIVFPECDWLNFAKISNDNKASDEEVSNMQVFNNKWLLGTLRIFTNLYC